MPVKNNFWKSLVGQNTQVLIAKAVAYTDDATLEDFVANAAEGELGFFKQSDHTVLAGNAAADPNTEIYVAVKRDGQVEKSIPFKLGELAVSKTAYEAPQKQSTTVVVSALTVAKGDIFEVMILETTPGNQPFPTYAYQVVAVTGETVDTAMAKLVTAINDTASKANKDRDLIVTASYDSGTNTLTLAAIDFGVTFRVQLRGVLADGGAAVTYGTPCKLGSGFPAQVRLYQDAGDLYKGVTTQYPLQGATPEDFGKPTDFVDNALEYDMYNIDGQKAESSKTPHRKSFFNNSIVIIVPNAGGATAEVTNVLDLN